MAFLSRRQAVLAAAAGLFALAGCAREDEVDETLASPDATAPALPAAPIDQVASLEIGRTWNGIVLSAYGIAPGIGYAEPRLVARRRGQAASDGFLDFDFVATPPDPGFDLAPGGDSRARLVRADRLLAGRQLRGVAGVRVHAARNGQQIAF